MERMQEGDQGRDFVRAEVTPESRHVPVALKDLAYQLVVVEPSGDAAEIRPSLATLSCDGVTVSALLSLNDGCAHMFKRRSSHNEFRLNRDSTPCIHVW